MTRPPRRLRLPRLDLALSAFLMSVAITLINAFYAVRGAEITVQPPEQVLLVRDGEGDAAVLSVILPLNMINKTRDYGDVLMEATLGINGTGGAFAYEGTVTAVFDPRSEKAAENCELGARCLALPQLLVVARADELLDMPSGAAKAKSLAFPLSSASCEGPAKACGRFGSFGQAVSALAGKSLRLVARLDFDSDGRRELACSTSPLDGEYLAKTGWISLKCLERSATGEPFL